MNKQVKEKANPDVEFSNDLMMRELHKIQIKITNEIKYMNGKELSDFFKKKARDFGEADLPIADD